MRIKEIEFYSDNWLLHGCFYLPDDWDDSKAQPLTVICSGFTGVNSFHPARFARALTAKGHLCLGFDYRGFVKSEGITGRVVLTEQTRDICHAVDFALTQPFVDNNKVYLAGWGMAAGMVIEATASLDVAGLACLNGFYNGFRLQKTHRTPQDFRAFQKLVQQQRCQRSVNGEANSADPFDIYPLDLSSSSYVNDVLRQEPGFNGDVYSYELADSLLSWNPEAHARDCILPLFLAHGRDNFLHPVGEAQQLLKIYAGQVEACWLDNAGHTEWMLDDHPTFQHLCARLDTWLKAHMRYL